jgi:sugar phosphate isomerase/epimerase
MKRREFIQNSAALALGSWAMASSFESWGMPALSFPVGVQLYTFAKNIDNDLVNILKKLSEVGYTQVESFPSRKGGYFGMKPKEFSQLVKDNGLTWRSHHQGGTPWNPPAGANVPANMPKQITLRDNAQQVVDEVAEGGVKFLICSSIDIKTGDAVKAAVDILGKAGEIAKKAGLTFGFHNHDREFANVDGIVPYEMFLSQLNKDIKMELDLAWVSKAKVDPVELFKKNPGRFPLWHVKDFDKEFKTLMPVGSGHIDFKRIFENAKLAGLEYPLVEHDGPANAVESVTSSINYLKTILK